MPAHSDVVEEQAQESGISIIATFLGKSALHEHSQRNGLSRISNLNVQVKQFEMYYLEKRWELAQKCVMMWFIDIGIRHRMAPLQMLYSWLWPSFKAHFFWQAFAIKFAQMHQSKRDCPRQISLNDTHGPHRGVFHSGLPLGKLSYG